MQEIGLELVCNEIGEAFKKDDLKRVDSLLWAALDQFPELPQLWFYAGNLFFQLGRCAPAARCFEHCIDLDENPLVLANLGAAYRRLNMHDEGIRVLEAALDRDPNYAPALVNLGSMYVNEGCPEKGIPHLEKSIALAKAKNLLPERGTTWNLGLLYLEAGRFEEGFEFYRMGLGAERLMRSYGATEREIPEPELLQPAHSGTGKTLIVWGEQGIGDELMFGTCLPDAMEEFDEVIFECHPRLEKLHRMAHPGLRIFPTRKEEHIGWPIEHGIKADYKCPIGDLAARYRPDVESFRRTVPRYECDEVERIDYRAHLRAIAKGKPIIGLATHGGVIQTARQYRTLRVTEIERLFAETDCLFVSLDYDDMTSLAVHLQEKFGPERYQWFPSVVQHWDYDHTAALAAACDLNVTVCQSVAHLSAGLGVPTRVLTPKRCAWRYANVAGENWYWYAGAKLYRQENDDWRAPIERVIADIKELA